MPARRLEDKIRDLCTRALAAREPEWSTTLAELQLAIQEHVLRISNLTTLAVVAGQTPKIGDRRRRCGDGKALKPGA